MFSRGYRSRMMLISSGVHVLLVVTIFPFVIPYLVFNQRSIASACATTNPIMKSRIRLTIITATNTVLECMYGFAFMVESVYHPVLSSMPGTFGWFHHTRNV